MPNTREMGLWRLVNNAFQNSIKKFGDIFAKDVTRDLLANGVENPVRCKVCKWRCNEVHCPMYFVEKSEYDDGDGYMEVDYITHDRTTDNGYCDRGERKDNG